MLSDTQKRFVELAKKVESLREESKKVWADLESTMGDLGLGSYVQDPETLLVYKIETPKGTFVEFKTISYCRTAKEGEKGGHVLSKKDAEAAGFILKVKE